MLVLLLSYCFSIVHLEVDRLLPTVFISGRRTFNSQSNDVILTLSRGIKGTEPAEIIMDVL